MRAVLSLALAAVLALGLHPGPAQAGYSTNVYRARQWLRERTTDRAFHCAHILWDRESHWHPRAGEPWGAYGIPQAVPGYKMARAGSDWRTNALTQVRWGRHYVKGRYGSFCRALRFQTAYGWY